LPTEAEWEYAARGGNKSLTARGNSPDYFYSGSNTANDVAWYNGNNGNDNTATYGTKSVKGKLPNALGLYDMSGNVSEWCWNWYQDYSTEDIGTDPVGPTTVGSDRVLRGTAWTGSLNAVSSREKYTPDYRSNSFGFRVVLGH
jgi:formylglycine-generating enzyme required for sulfatase activity